MSHPFYVIAASVPPSNRLVNFHGTGSNGAAYLLSSLPRFRFGSFDVAIPHTPDPGPEDSIELRWGDRKILRLFQDGTLTFGCRADSEFLGWGVTAERFAAFPRLNPVAVAEVHASFVHSYGLICARLKKQPERILFDLSLTGGVWNDSRLFLTHYYSAENVDWQVVDQYVLQVDPAEAEVEAESDEVRDHPNAVAGRLLRAFASWFDMPEEDIPFTRLGDSGELEVDLDTILSLRG